MFHVRFSRSLLLILPFVTLFPGTPSSVHADINCESEYASAGNRYTEVVIDSSISGISFIYGQNNAWVSMDSDGTWWYYYLFNDNYNRVIPILFSELQVYSPEEWYRPFALFPFQEQIRYTSCQLAMSNGEVFPQAYFEIQEDDRWKTMYFYDEFGIAGEGWTSPIPLQDPPPLPSDFNMSYPMTVPIHGTGGMHVLTKSGNGFEYRRFNFYGNHEIGPTTLLTGVYGTGYEIPVFISGPMGQIVAVVIPGYRLGDDTPGWEDDPNNPLLPVLQYSMDFGETWSDIIWLDKNTVADLPGTNPGCDNVSSAWGYFCQKKVASIIDSNGNIHLATTLMDPANNTAPANYDSIDADDYGLWHIVGQYDSWDRDYSWNAQSITYGTKLVPSFPADSFYGGKSSISNPSLSMAFDDRIVCGYSDCSVINPDGSWFMDYFFIGYIPGYSYWGSYLNVTNSMDTNMVYFKTPHGNRSDNCCAYGIPGDYTSNGPLVSYFIPLNHIRFPNSISDSDTRPYNIQIFDPYPNPASRDMSIRFSLSEPADIIASAYDISGHLVSGIYNASLDTGDHTILWNPKSLASGTYCIRIRADDAVASKNIVVIR